MTNLYGFLVFLLGLGIFVVILKKLFDTPIKENGPQKNENRYWNKYVDKQNTRAYQQGTRIGKNAVRLFVKGLDIRMNNDVKFKEVYNNNMYWKYAICQFLFYKWLAEICEFEPDANEKINVPILTIFKTQHDHFRYIANFVGHQLYGQTQILKHLNGAIRYMKGHRYRARRKRIKGHLN